MFLVCECKCGRRITKASNLSCMLGCLQAMLTYVVSDTMVMLARAHKQQPTASYRSKRTLLCTGLGTFRAPSLRVSFSRGMSFLFGQ